MATPNDARRLEKRTKVTCYRIGKEWQPMKYAGDRPYADPEHAARRLMQHARAFEVVQDGRIYIEKLNGPFLYVDRGTPEEYAAGVALTVERGWLEPHDSGTFVKLTQSGTDLFA